MERVEKRLVFMDQGDLILELGRIELVKRVGSDYGGFQKIKEKIWFDIVGNRVFCLLVFKIDLIELYGLIERIRLRIVMLFLLRMSYLFLDKLMIIYLFNKVSIWCYYGIIFVVLQVLEI